MQVCRAAMQMSVTARVQVALCVPAMHSNGNEG